MTTVPAVVDPNSLRGLQSVREPFSILDWFFSPQRLTPEADGAAYRPSGILLIVAFAIPMLRNRAFVAVAAPAILFVILVLARGAWINVRYLVPAIPPLTIAAAYTIATIAARSGGKLGKITTVVIAALTVIPTGDALIAKLRRTRAIEHVIGLLPRDRYANPVAEYVNSMVPPNARLLLLFEGRSYGITSEVLPDNVLINWPLLAPAVTAPHCLEGRGISHILVATSNLDYYVRRGLDPETIRWNEFEDFAGRCLQDMDHRRDFSLFRVRTGP